MNQEQEIQTLKVCFDTLQTAFQTLVDKKTELEREIERYRFKMIQINKKMELIEKGMVK